MKLSIGQAKMIMGKCLPNVALPSQKIWRRASSSRPLNLNLRKPMKGLRDVTLTTSNHLFSKKKYKEKNLIFSPFALHAALSVMAAGSAAGTLDELLSFLRFDSIDQLNTFFPHLLSAVLSNNAAPSSHRLSFASGMWAKSWLPLSHSFKQLAATHYKTTLASM